MRTRRRWGIVPGVRPTVVCHLLSKLLMGISELLSHSGVQRPKFRRRGSKDSNRSTKSNGDSDEEGSAPFPNVDVLLDDSMPEEYFKQDTLRLVHLLRIHGWSHVHPDMSEDMEMDRISGALTNAVYKVSPPAYVKDRIKKEYEGRPYHHRVPQPLLLRVYGLQVGVLIDREEELKVVEKLTKHNIGARVLGTFTNGRFEQFLNAKALNKEDLRNPDTSMQIAKRMRDLHNHVGLSKEQIEQGPEVFDKLKKWTKSFTERMDELSGGDPEYIRQLVGSDIPTLLRAIDAYKEFLIKKHGKDYFQDVVFCHNDTQYGNILRVEPPRGSPLLKPQLEHRQLVVIDFEYAGANNRAYDIANHFCEWMSDYHHPLYPYHIWTDRYPTREEQLQYLSSYVEHDAPSLDETILEPIIEKLYHEVYDWLPAPSLHWAMWGVIQAPKDVQAKLDRIDRVLSSNGIYEFQKWQEEPQAQTGVGEEDEFDYIKYSQEKFSLFWKDLKALGISV